MTGHELMRHLQRAAVGHIEAAFRFGINAAQMLRLTQGKDPIPPEIAEKAEALPTFRLYSQYHGTLPADHTH